MRAFVVGLLFVLLVPTGAGAASVNLIANPDFDDAEGISSWISGAQFEWDMNLDVNADANSGSIRIVNDASGGFTARSVFSNCEPIADVDYELITWAYTPSGQASTSGGAAAFLAYYASPNCVDFMVSVFPEEPRVALLDQWQQYRGTLRPPVGAKSARMGVDIVKKEPGGSLVGNHDAISWRLAPLSSEDSRFGAETITRDNVTGLGWLDITSSTSFSYNEIILELDSGGAFEGFRLATVDEVLELWVNAGINVEAGFLNEFVTENFLPIVNLMTFVGVTGPGIGSLGGGNFFDFTSGYIESVPDSRGFIQLGSLGADPDPTLTGRASLPFRPPDSATTALGAWLIPEPGGDALALAALGTIVVLLRNRTSSEGVGSTP